MISLIGEADCHLGSFIEQKEDSSRCKIYGSFERKGDQYRREVRSEPT